MPLGRIVWALLRYAVGDRLRRAAGLDNITDAKVAEVIEAFRQHGEDLISQTEE